MKRLFLFVILLLFGSQPLNVQAFRFSSHENGNAIVAGTTIKVTVDPGDLPPLFGVLLSSTRGVITPILDSLMPYEWSIAIPTDYFGPLTLWAIGRRYFPIPNPPQASLTLHVVFPTLTLKTPVSKAPLFLAAPIFIRTDPPHAPKGIEPFRFE